MTRSFGLRIIWSLLLSLAAPTLAHAYGGDISGGGGNSVVCFDDETIPPAVRAAGDVGPYLDRIRSIEAFDLHEARLPYGLQSRQFPEIIPVRPDERGHEWKYVQRIRARVAPFVPELEAAFRSTEILLGEDGSTPCSGGLQHGNITCQDTRIEPIHDMDAAGSFDSKHCVLVTTASNHLKDGQAYLTFDRRILNHPAHSEISRATLFLHELVYLTARVFDGQRESRHTRELVAALLGQNEPLTLGDLLDAIDGSDILGLVDPAPSEIAGRAASLMAEEAKAAFLANPPAARARAVTEAVGRIERAEFLDLLDALPWSAPGYWKMLKNRIAATRDDLIAGASKDDEHAFRIRAAQANVVASTELAVSWDGNAELEATVVPVDPLPLPSSLEFLARGVKAQVASSSGGNDAPEGRFTVHGVACFTDAAIAARARESGGQLLDEDYSRIRSLRTLGLAFDDAQGLPVAKPRPSEAAMDLVARLGRERIRFASPELADEIGALAANSHDQAPHLHDYIEAVAAPTGAVSLIQGRPECAIVPVAHVQARRRYGRPVRTRIDADRRLLELDADNLPEVLLQASWAINQGGSEDSSVLSSRLAGLALTSAPLTVKRFSDAIQAADLDQLLYDGASYPAILAKTIVERMAEAAPSGAHAVDQVYSTRSRSEWRKQVFSIPGAPLASIRKLDRYLLGWAAKIRAKAGGDLGDIYADTIPEEVDGFFDLEYPLP